MPTIETPLPGAKGAAASASTAIPTPLLTARESLTTTPVAFTVATPRKLHRAWEERITVEHAIGRLRRYQALSAVNRHGRKGHEARVRAVAGLVNRMLERKAT